MVAQHMELSMLKQGWFGADQKNWSPSLGPCHCLLDISRVFPAGLLSSGLHLASRGSQSHKALSICLISNPPKFPNASGIEFIPQSLASIAMSTLISDFLENLIFVSLSPHTRYNLFPQMGSILFYSGPLPMVAPYQPDQLLPRLQGSVKMSFPETLYCAASSGFPRHIIHTFGRAHIRELIWECGPHLYTQLPGQCLVSFWYIYVEQSEHSYNSKFKGMIENLVKNLLPTPGFLQLNTPPPPMIVYVHTSK